MTMPEAIATLGLSRSQWELRNMKIALAIGSYANTDEAWTRYHAACYVLRRYRAYSEACQRIRDARHGH